MATAVDTLGAERAPARPQSGRRSGRNPARSDPSGGAGAEKEAEIGTASAPGGADGADGAVAGRRPAAINDGAEEYPPVAGRTTRETMMLRIKKLGARLDAGELKLRRGQNGRYARYHASRLAGVSMGTLAKSKELSDALDAVAAGRTLEDPPRRAPRTRMAKPAMIRRLTALSDGLPPTFELPTLPDGGPDRNAIARLAGLKAGWEADRDVLSRIDQIAAEHDPAAIAVDEAEALRLMGDWRSRLLRAKERVPAFEGTPAIALCARDIGVPASAIVNSEVLRDRLMEIAGEVGLRAAVPEHGSDTILSSALNALADERDTCALRGDVFPADDLGQLDHDALLRRLRLSPDIVVHHRYRARAAAAHRELWAAAGRGDLEPEACLLNDARAVTGRYELYVSAGIHAVVRDQAGEVALGHFERSYQLAAGTCRRFPEIAARVQAAAPATPDTITAVNARGAAKEAVMEALACYGASPAAARGVAATPAREASHVAIERAMLLREGSIDHFEEARRAVEELVARLGKKARKSRKANREDPIEPLVDRYIEHVNERGYLYPRHSPFTNHISGPGTAAEITKLTGVHVDAERLGIKWLTHITNGCRRVYTLGRVVSRRTTGTEPEAHDRLVAIIKRHLAKWKDGLPGDPLDDTMVDLVRIADATWIDVETLASTPAYIELIDTWRLKYGIKPFQHGATVITIAELLAHARLRRAGDTTSGRPGEAVARTARALNDLAIGSGVEMDADVSAIPELCSATDEAALPAQVVRLRGYLAELRRERALADDLPTSLKILLRSRDMTPGALAHELNRRLGRAEGGQVLLRGQTVQRWVQGILEPCHYYQDCVDEIERIFELAAGTLTRKMSHDSRARGPIELSEDGVPIPDGYDVHLPLGYERLTPDRQRAILLDIAENVRCQDTEFSHRQRVVCLDEYRLRKKHWPVHLKREWKAYVVSRREPDNLEIGAPVKVRKPTGKAGKRDKRDEPLGVAGANRYENALESFFGFLVRSTTVDPATPSIAPGTPEWRREKAEADAMAVGHRVRPGLGVDPDHLTLGLIGLRDLYRAWVAYMVSRSGDESRETLLVVNLFANLVKEGGFVRDSAEMRDRTADFLDWWREWQQPDLRQKFRLQPLEREPEAWAARCDEAIELYDVEYEKLKDRLAGRNDQPKLEKRRDPFAPIRKVLKSKKPRKYYGLALKRLVASRPTQVWLRTGWLRDTVLCLILDQTLLRIKNLSRLTYRKDGSGQLRFEDGKWVVQIHKDHFKNKKGRYFIGGDYFRMVLRDKHGLYALIEQYLAISREHYLAIMDANEAAGVIAKHDAGEKEKAPPEAFFDDLEDFDDGEPDHDRFFLSKRGVPFTASGLARRYYAITIRYFARNLHRKRGVRGMMPHGPHCVRHIGATAVLKKTGSYAEAGRVIQDDERTARECYTEFGPVDQGERAAQMLEECDA